MAVAPREEDYLNKHLSIAPSEHPKSRHGSRIGRGLFVSRAGVDQDICASNTQMHHSAHAQIATALGKRALAVSNIIGDR